MLGELDDGPRRAVAIVGHGVDQGLDVALEQRPDAHRAWLEDGEDRGVGQPVGTELPGGLAEGVDDRVGGRVVRLLHPVMGAGDHRIGDDGNRGVRALATGLRRPASARASPMNSS